MLDGFYKFELILAARFQLLANAGQMSMKKMEKLRAAQRAAQYFLERHKLTPKLKNFINFHFISA